MMANTFYFYNLHYRNYLFKILSKIAFIIVLVFVSYFLPVKNRMIN
ncbi:hypothetical protein PAUR_a0274 [Pseudoalteromonas aurantia 208]|uniref:Uncharacterized protein n=1 Tax=Pseudoalteromonas aurantia 208 TaxID=1314867 RepID=A0ABR9E7N4_9GAMM|nr:hypothetical protein [Pseudoalteromonas aurantia 208]